MIVSLQPFVNSSSIFDSKPMRVIMQSGFFTNPSRSPDPAKRYGKIFYLMNNVNAQVLPAPPSLTKSLMAGFDAITNHIGLILFPVVLDLLLWFGPHVRLSRLVQSFINEVSATAGMNTPEMVDATRAYQQLWTVMAERFNLLMSIRSYPIGIPSLMVSREPMTFPGGTPSILEAPTFGAAFSLWLLLTLLGLMLGALYFSFVAQASVSSQTDWRRIFGQWPWVATQVLFLALFWLALILGVSIPFSCILVLILSSGIGLNSIVTLLFGGILIWLLLPLVFSPHGIFLKGLGMWASVRAGVHLTRMTLPSTALFILFVVILNEGLDVLWRIPPEASWLAVIGIVGHAFVTTGLLAATFVYYREADLWVQKIQQVKLALSKELIKRS